MNNKNTKPDKCGNKTLRARLRTSFISIASIVILVSIISIFSLTSLQKSLNNFQSDTLKTVDLTWNARVDLISIQNSILKISSTKNNTLNQSHADDLNKAKVELNESIELLNTLPLSQEASQALTTINSILVELESMEDEALALGQANKIDEAVAVLESGYLDLSNEAAKQFEIISNVISAESIDTIDSMNQFVLIVILLLALFCVISMLASLAIAKTTIDGIIKPLSQIERAMKEISQGNLDIQLDYHSNNALGRLADVIRDTSQELYKYVKNIDDTLSEMANYNFTVTVDIEYRGMFSNIKTSFEKIIFILNDITKKIKDAADGVADGSDQISEASQSLADGATDQSSSVQQLLATMTNLSAQVEGNAKDARTVSAKSVESQEIINKGNNHMNELMKAMEEISKASERISDIITVIDGISGQTNLLALNASIEAARAGENGKGFAVVANEIGKLANETSESTKITAELINQSLEAVKVGERLAKETASILLQVVEESSAITSLADNVSDACAEQSNSLSQVNSAIESISGIVEETASIAEETSSSSQSLSTHATNLAETMSNFTLK